LLDRTIFSINKPLQVLSIEMSISHCDVPVDRDENAALGIGEFHEITTL
jgi:hypothetical protein